jgi:sulfur carrier protein
MLLQVNGENLNLNGSTIADLVKQMDLAGKRLAVEVNREIIPKSTHATFTLKEHDTIEIIHAIGGG